MLAMLPGPLAGGRRRLESLRSYSRLDQDLSVLRVVAPEDLPEGLGRSPRDVEPAVGEALADVGLIEHPLELAVELLHDVPGRRRRHHHAVPGRQLEVRDRLGYGQIGRAHV